MSKDPFEELFGDSESDEPRTEPQPVPARQRLSYEQAERVRTSQLAAAPAKRTSRSGIPPKTIPWIIVGAVALVAILVSMILINMSRSSEPSSAPTSAPTTGAPTETTSPETEAPDADDEADKPAEDEKPDADAVPKVDVGPTSELNIEPWAATSQLSQKFGMTSYYIPDSTNLELSSPLIDSLPESCAAMRTQWGATKNADGTFSIRKPAEPCADAKELYDELWGLTDAFVKSIKPVA
ncbi:hypothetical protein [Leucobacter sp. USHLN153]|uniref:hypothetical protein n=1 Tax=Leucobacter sp. USHLN153 TaxID=3081268 RepID=UPI003018CDE9